MLLQETLTVRTQGRGTYEITGDVQGVVGRSAIQTGLCHVFIRHTSASLIVCENADPSVRSDLERFVKRLVPDGDAIYEHTLEGPDDMPAHVRSVLTNLDLTLPVTDRRCALGTWQGVFLYEHRTRPHVREVIVTVRD